MVEYGTELFQLALRLVKACPENCDTSCYRCLRSFKNKFEHGLLDRHVAAELLEYLLTGTLPEFDEERLRNSTALLYRDLLRQDDGSIDFKAGATVKVAGAKDTEVPILAVTKSGKQFAIALSGPLTTDHPAESAMRELREKATELQFIVVNELLVRGNLPAATREIRQRLGD